MGTSKINKSVRRAILSVVSSVIKEHDFFFTFFNLLNFFLKEKGNRKNILAFHVLRKYGLKLFSKT